MSGYSERVRTAMALDDIELIVVKLCGKMAREDAENTTRYQNELCYDIAGAVADAAEKYGIEESSIRSKAMTMLHDELCRALHGLVEVEHVKAYMKDGEVVGMKARFFKDLWKRSA